MSSWVYIFSQFTPEALLFEALIIALLCCGYALFWVLRKRRFGVADTELPSGPVKAYLNELITNAEQLRIQLFGLLSTDADLSQLQRNFAQTLGHPTAVPVAAASPAAASSDPELQKKLVELETKLKEQSKAVETISQDKVRLEKELSEAVTKSQSLLAADGSIDVKGLEEKIRDLEARLAEYSVIEDDLANLKRLQQENAQLKAALAAKGNAPATPAAEEAAPPAQEAPQVEPEPPAEATPEAAAPAAAAPASPEAPASPATAAPTEADLASLATQVENSLPSPSDAPEAPPPAEASAPAEPAAAQPPPSNNGEQSDADLVAEFEKMLNS